MHHIYYFNIFFSFRCVVRDGFLKIGHADESKTPSQVVKMCKTFFMTEIQIFIAKFFSSFFPLFLKYFFYFFGEPVNLSDEARDRGQALLRRRLIQQVDR